MPQTLPEVIHILGLLEIPLPRNPRPLLRGAGIPVFVLVPVPQLALLLPPELALDPRPRPGTALLVRPVRFERGFSLLRGGHLVQTHLELYAALQLRAALDARG